jgi:transcriptional regulator with XRE-family HTH domain
MARQELARFGKRVRSLRLAKQWTQEELAARSGLHVTYVGGIERGERNIALVNILKLARTLGCTACDLFAGEPR